MEGPEKGTYIFGRPSLRAKGGTAQRYTLGGSASEGLTPYRSARDEPVPQPWRGTHPCRQDPLDRRGTNPYRQGEGRTRTARPPPETYKIRRGGEGRTRATRAEGRTRTGWTVRDAPVRRPR